MSAGQPETSPTASDKTNIAPVQHETIFPDSLPSSGAAIFSTNLCNQPPCAVSKPPHPVIVRGGDKIKAVVDAAGLWQRKFRWQCLCIFPGQGWVIEDLWDAADIHLDTATFLQEVLTFISRDTYYHAKGFAEKWSRAHPDRLELVGGDMKGVYDPDNPLAIVDKIFVNGETNDFPKTFLWHVTHLMRTAMIEVSRANTAAAVTKESTHVQQQSQEEQQAISKVTVEAPAVEAGTPVATKSSQQSSAPTESAPSKKNRKKSRSRSSKLTVSTEPSSTVNVSVPVPAAPCAAPSQPGPRPVPKRAPSYGLPPPGAYHTEPTGNIMGGATVPYMMSPIVPPQAMHVPKNMPRNMASGSYNQATPPQGWGENVNRITSGPYSRMPSSTMSNMQSPQFVPLGMSMTESMGIPLNAMAPYVQSHAMMPVLAPNQPFDPAIVSRSMIPYQPMSMPTPPMGRVYLHQPHNGPVPRGVSMGDMTSNGHSTSNMVPRNMDPCAPMPRRVSNYNNNGALYDPYGGLNPKFSDPAAYNRGRKSNQNNFANQPGRPRKASTSGSRPGYSQHGVDRSGNMPSNGSRYAEYSSTRNFHEEDDPTVTGNQRSGCRQNWIGPENETVDELFMGDLPESVQEHELKLLFEQQTGVTPSRISKKHKQGHSRGHAFITFASASDARKAFQIHNRSPHLRDGSILVSITVPRRFFQKGYVTDRRSSFTPGSYNGPSYTDQTERNARGVTRMSSHDEEGAILDTEPAAAVVRPMYSPQDVRSDLLKKPHWQSDHNDPALNGSPEARKSKRNQSSLTTSQKDKHVEPVEKDATTDGEVKITNETDASSQSPVKAEVATTLGDTQAATEPTTDLAECVEPKSTNKPISGKQKTSLTNTSTVAGNAAGMAVDASPQPLEYPEAPNSKRDVEKSDTEFDFEPSPVKIKAPVMIVPSKSAKVVREPEPLVTEGKVDESKDPFKVAVESSLRQAEETVSDDDMNNDASFQSAQETQPVKVESEPVPEFRDEPILADQAATTPAILANQESPEPDNMSSPQAATEKIPSSRPQVLLADSEQDLATTPDKAIVPGDSIEDTTTSTQDLEAAPAQSVETAPVENATVAPVQTVAVMAASATFPAVIALKKNGAQQMESLSPFAKSKKTQTKRGKEQMKKQQKKERAEAGKTKAEKKTISSANIGGASAAEASDRQPGTPNTVPPKPDAPLTSTASVHDTAGQVGSEPVRSNGKGKASAVVSTVDQEKKVEGEGEDSGKPNGGNATSSPKEIGSVTHKTNIAKVAQVEPAKQVSSKASRAPSVHPHEGIGADVMGRQTDLPRQAVASPGSPGKSDDAQAPSKKNKPPPAVPHLIIHPRKSSTHLEGSQLNSAGVSSPLPSMVTVPKVPKVPQAAAQDMSQSTILPDAASVASSTTLIPEDTATMSPPSTADVFFTPLPTPSALAPSRVSHPEVEAAQATTPQNEVPKKKRKKNKKKITKKSDITPPSVFTPPESIEPTEPVDAVHYTEPAEAAPRTATLASLNDQNAGSSDVEDSGVDEDYTFYDPFSSQMSHIDAIRRGLRDPDSYFSRVNAKMAAENDAEEKHAATAKKLSEPALQRQIEGYMRENSSRFPVDAKMPSQNDVN